MNLTGDETSCERNYLEMLTFIFATTISFLSNAVFFLSMGKLQAPKENQLHLVVKVFTTTNAISVAALLPFSLASYISCGWIGGYTSCALSGFVSALFLGWSVLLMLLLCFYRYLALVKPFYYRTRLSPRKTKIIMAIAFAWSACHLCLPLCGVGGFRVHPKGWYCTIDLESDEPLGNMVVYMIIAEGVVLILVLLYLYGALRNAVCHERRVSQGLSPQQFRGANVPMIERKRGDFTKMTLLIAAVYWTCSLPYLGYRAVVVLSNGQYNNEDVYFYTQMLAYIHSFLNIVVFLVMNKQYRHAMKCWMGIHVPVVGNTEGPEGANQRRVFHEVSSGLPTQNSVYHDSTL